MKFIQTIAVALSVMLLVAGCDCGSKPAVKEVVPQAPDNRRVIVKVPDGKGFYFVYEFMRRDVDLFWTNTHSVTIRTKEKKYNFYGNIIVEEDR